MSAEEREMERSRREKDMPAILAARDQGNLSTKMDTKELHDLGKEFLDRQAHSGMNEP
jgi:hypothetical protein